MSEDRFFERLRADASALRYEPDASAMTRVSARIRARVASQPPTVAQLLASWFRPLATTLAALALAATIGIAFVPNDDAETIASNPDQISMAGDTYSVGE